MFLSILGLLVVALASLLLLLKSEPGFYQPIDSGSPDFDAAAKRVEDKLIEIRNVAAETHAAWARGEALRPTRYVITLTQNELNAFILKWAELNALRGQYEKWVRQPMIAFAPSTAIFAAQAIAGPTQCVISLHTEARLDDAGQIRLSVLKLQAGQLPVPATLWEQYTTSLASELDRQLPLWRREAALDRRSAANEAAVKAVYGELLRSALRDQPADPVLIIPVRSDRGLPVRVNELRITDGQINLTVTPLSPDQSEQFLARLKKSR